MDYFSHEMCVLLARIVIVVELVYFIFIRVVSLHFENI